MRLLAGYPARGIRSSEDFGIIAATEREAKT